MSRKPPSQDELKKREQGRKRAAANRKSATVAISGNDQFTNPKFWASLPGDIVSAVGAALGKARDKALKAERDAVAARLAELDAELGE